MPQLSVSNFVCPAILPLTVKMKHLTFSWLPHLWVCDYEMQFLKPSNKRQVINRCLVWKKIETTTWWRGFLLDSVNETQSSEQQVEKLLLTECRVVGQTFLHLYLNGLRSGARKQSSWALKLQAVRINSVQRGTASRQPLQSHTMSTGGDSTQAKAIYLLNTPSGLFIAVVHSARPLEPSRPPSCLLRSGKSKWLFLWMRYVKPLG